MKNSLEKPKSRLRHNDPRIDSLPPPIDDKMVLVVQGCDGVPSCTQSSPDSGKSLPKLECKTDDL